MCACLDVRVRRRSSVSSEPCLPINSALCCPWSLWKMRNAHHGDWHCTVSPVFLNRHTPTRLLPSKHHLHCNTGTHMCTHPYIQPAGTDNIRRCCCSSNSISLQFAIFCSAWCMTTTPIHWVWHTSLGAGGWTSHVWVVNACSCYGNTTGKLLYCVGQTGTAQFCQGFLTLGMMKCWWDGSRQPAAEKCLLLESMFHTTRTYLHLGCFTVQW